MNVLFFLWKYKILKDPVNLSYQTERFFKLSKRTQRAILDKYFKNYVGTNGLETYFDSKESRYYQNGQEINFFHCYYFDKKLIEYNIKNISLIDKFIIDNEKKEFLISYTLDLIKQNDLYLSVNDLIIYPDDLPKSLSSNLDFMSYLVKDNPTNIKYITYNEKCASRQRDLISGAIQKIKTMNLEMKNFCKNDGRLPKILESNEDFLLYLIENDISNTIYLKEDILENQTITNRKLIIDTIIKSLKKNSNYLKELEKNTMLADMLNQDENFILYMIDLNIDNIGYVDWHNLTEIKKQKLIDYFTSILEKKNLSFDIMKYPFHNLFFQNYRFMNYLMKNDFRWIAVTRLNNFEENNKLVDLFFQTIERKKYRFRLEDFLEDGKYINPNLVENRKMLHYFFENNVAVVKHINFFNLTSSKIVTENILREIESKNYEFSNENFLVNGKYPIPLSNSYRFMRYVIDKNFNHLAYIDISMIDKNELKRIINYAFRMVYYIRGDNKNLNFDIDGYFKGTEILHNEYFIECLKSL